MGKDNYGNRFYMRESITNLVPFFWLFSFTGLDDEFFRPQQEVKNLTGTYSTYPIHLLHLITASGTERQLRMLHKSSTVQTL